MNSGAAKFAIEQRAVNDATFCCPDELGWQPQVDVLLPCNLTNPCYAAQRDFLVFLFVLFLQMTKSSRSKLWDFVGNSFEFLCTILISISIFPFSSKSL